MPELKLAKLPERTPVKIAITVSPELSRMLQVYAELYRERYGETEPVHLLIPAMLDSFLKSDIAFSKAWKGRGRDSTPQPDSTLESPRVRRRDPAESIVTTS